MRLEAINLGRRETIRLEARTLDTGIDKQPVERAYAGMLRAADCSTPRSPFASARRSKRG